MARSVFPMTWIILFLLNLMFFAMIDSIMEGMEGLLSDSEMVGEAGGFLVWFIFSALASLFGSLFITALIILALAFYNWSVSVGGGIVISLSDPISLQDNQVASHDQAPPGPAGSQVSESS